MSAEAVFKFGKHRGETIQSVLDNDIDYIGWCLDRGIEFIVDNLDDDEIDLIIDEYKNRKHKYPPL